MSGKESAQEIDRRASEWLARRDRGPMDAAERAELDAWLAGDPRRAGAFLRAQSAWSVLDRMRSLVSRPASDVGPARDAAPGRSRRSLAIGVAGALAASLVAAVLILPKGERYSTALGEIRHVPLHDGSIASLNTESRMTVLLEAHVRKVEVRQGEVWFHVAKDAARPFIVAAGRVRVRAVGTAFSVRRHKDGAEVVVTEGVVSVWKDAEPDRAVRLSGGSKIFIDAQVATPEVTRVVAKSERSLAWRSGQIALDGDTLAQAAAEFNRYNERKIVVNGARLAAEPLVGLFRTNDPEGFAIAAASTLGARLVQTDSQILLSREPTR